jgi:alkanesulfonate monooxygenase SsuD/methylene tetrahydromethanopterin reductase-like flavin-dependent oxidoreductase (luciferase family)
LVARLGVQLPEVERDVRRDELAAMACAAEESGFDSIWLGDHLLYRDPDQGPWDCWTTLAWLAGVTDRVELGPLVACTAFHPPGVLARMAATVDEVSGGRLVLGLGAGWNEVEFEAFGIPFEKRVARFEEAFTIIRHLAAGERVTFEGEHYRVRDALLLPPPARPMPLMVGTRGRRILAAALPHVETWNTWYAWYGNTVEGFAALSGSIDARVRRSACVLVAVDGGAGERVRDVTPVEPAQLGEHLAALARVGADEAILVLDPINARSVEAVAEALA